PSGYYIFIKMIYKPTYFDIEELVCEHIYDQYGSFAWMFFDTKLLILLDTIRDRLKKPVYINDWQIHGLLSREG
ncbi:MAG: hypothetical protein WD512_01800, partial [Candidatus Paceibacterota bacterium]